MVICWVDSKTQIEGRNMLLNRTMAPLAKLSWRAIGGAVPSAVPACCVAAAQREASGVSQDRCFDWQPSPPCRFASVKENQQQRACLRTCDLVMPQKVQ